MSRNLAMKRSNRAIRAAAFATAVAFSSLAKAEIIHFSHQWRDFYGDGRQITIPINEERVRQALVNSKDLHNHKSIYRTIINNAKILAIEISTSNVRARVKDVGMEYKLEIEYRKGFEGEAKGISSRIHEFINGAYSDLREVTYYTYSDELNSLVINYSDIVSDYEDVFDATHKIFLASDTGKSKEDQLDDRLSFLQSIPYDDMTHNDFDLMTPIRMLAEGRGDCESKQIYLAGLLGKLFPGRQIHLVLLPYHEHILLALETYEGEYATYTQDSRNYLILDATGPSLLPASGDRELVNTYSFEQAYKIWHRIY